jgi:aldehyde:ferredoxin oxidoreductase
VHFMNGYAGKILRINLTDRKITIIPTSRYEKWVGGHGMGSAIFFDLVKDKTIDGFHPGNVVTIMTSPLSGTLTPAAGARTEVQGIGVHSYPIGWFTRSNFGGRFSSMLKYAGWDGIVLEGKATRPVWIDIRNEKVVIRDCQLLSLWGQDTKACQETIWRYVAGDKAYNDWLTPTGVEGERTTQQPAILAIGPAGENLSRMACLIHDATHGSGIAGQGGFGAVWGSKNLKAISVIGTGEIKVHDPRALIAARLEQKQQYAFDPDNPKTASFSVEFDSPPTPLILSGAIPGTGRPREGQRPQACVGCHSGCRARFASGLGNGATCTETMFYRIAKTVNIQRQACELISRYGFNAYEMYHCEKYLAKLNSLGVLGPGKAIDCPLDFKDCGSLAFADQFVRMIVYRNDGKDNPHAFGDTLAEGLIWAAKKWGRLDGEDSDLKTGLLPYPFWGQPVHKEPTAQLEWGYGTILGDRDICEHDFDWIKWDVLMARSRGQQPRVSAEAMAKIVTDKMVPFQGDELMFDYSTANMYSEHMAKLVSWHRYYTRFWKESALFCDFRWGDFVNINAPDKVGTTGIAEPKFLNAVTGKSLTFLDSIELGKKIWNLDHAIWTLQGRHRDMVHFADYAYDVISNAEGMPALYMPGKENGKWVYIDTLGRTFDRKGVEEFKTHFYKLQGWDVTTGYPTRQTLTSLGLSYVADELEKAGKLGSVSSKKRRGK